jgi:hypothetical protein
VVPFTIACGSCFFCQRELVWPLLRAGPEPLFRQTNLLRVKAKFPRAVEIQPIDPLDETALPIRPGGIRAGERDSSTHRLRDRSRTINTLTCSSKTLCALKVKVFYDSVEYVHSSCRPA